jgi:hypothetical protein
MAAPARVLTSGANEAALTWAPEFGGLELLKAAYQSHRFPLHAHETFAIAMHTRGAARSWYSGGTWLIPPGTVAVYAPGEVHTGEPANDQGWCYRMFYVPAELMQGVGWRAGHVPASSDTGPVLPDQILCCRLLLAHRVFEISRSPLRRESVLLDALGLLVSRLSTRPRDPLPSTAPCPGAGLSTEARCASVCFDREEALPFHQSGLPRGVGSPRCQLRYATPGAAPLRHAPPTWPRTDTDKVI